MRKNVNLSLEVNVYQETRRTVPAGQVSPLVNNLLKEYLKKKKREDLKEAYRRTAQSKAMREEDKIWEGSIEDGIDE